MQNIYDARQKGKLIFLLISVLLVGGVLYVSNDRGAKENGNMGRSDA